MSRHRYVGVVVAVAMAIQFLAPTIASANTGIRAHSNTSRSASSHSRHHVARHSARTITSKTSINAPTAGGATLTIKKNVCDSIGQQNTCNKAQNPSCSSTTGANCYVAVFTVYQGTDNTGTNLGTCTVTLTQSNGAESNQLCSQTLTSGTTYTVCETTQIGGFIAFPRPDLSTGGTNESATATCLTFTATSGNAVLQFLDVRAGNLTLCKTAGPGVTSGQVFSFTVTGATIDNTVRTQTVSVAAGSCQTISNFFFAGETVTIQETVPAGGTVTSVVGATAGTTAGSSTLTLVAGANTVTYTNAISGTLQICKASTGTPAVTGTFSFGVAGQTTTAAVGTCSTLLTVPAGSQTITETAPDGSTTLANCLIVQNGLPGPVCTPSGNDVTVNIVGGQTTVVTFTNRVVTGTLQICKIAGAGVPSDGSATFDFTVTPSGGTATPVTGVAAGPGPAGNCVAAGTFPVGTSVTVAETTTGYTVTPASGSQTLTIASGTNTATFTNAQFGTLQVCKIAGPGVTVGTAFHFSVTPAGGTATPLTVAAGAAPAGTCASAGDFPVGTSVTVAETDAGFTTTPSASQTVTIAAGTSLTNTLTFTNSQSSTLTVCKVAGTGVTIGTPFGFSVTPAGGTATPLTVSAGAGPTGTCASAGTFPVGTSVTVAETTTGYDVTPSASQTATIAAGGNTLTFTNTVPPPTTGTLVICKQNSTQAPVTSETTFTFNVAGQNSFTNTGNAIMNPAGSCASTLTFSNVPAGGTSVAEMLTAADIANAIGATNCSVAVGSGSATTCLLTNNATTVNVVAGQTTTVTITNEQVLAVTTPVCTINSITTNGSGQTVVSVTFTDTVNIASIVTLSPPTTNFSTDIGSITFPAASPVTVTGTQINPNVPGTLQLRATDVNGASITCDPSVGQLRAGRSAMIFRNITYAEHWVKLSNQSRNPETIALTVNGHRIALHLAAGRSKTFNIAWALHRGTNNVVTMKVLGKRGNTALAMIHD